MKIFQSWDDGVIDDIRVTEILRKYGAKATFNLNINLNKNSHRTLGWKYGEKEVWWLSREEMPEIYDGFEVASHSMNHPCLTQCDDNTLKVEVEESRLIIRSMFNQPVNGFCYPFGDVDERVKNALREAGYTHARGVNEIPYSFLPDDPFEFNPHCHFQSDNFWEIYERLKSEGSSFFFFWGHSYEAVNDKMWKEFERKIRKLSMDPETEWANISEMFG